MDCSFYSAQSCPQAKIFVSAMDDGLFSPFIFFYLQSIQVWLFIKTTTQFTLFSILFSYFSPVN